MESYPEYENNKFIYFQKINIFGDSEVGKTSLINCMLNYENDNFEIKPDSNRSSKGDYNQIVQQIKLVKFKINENRKVYYNVYETSLNRYDAIKVNLDVLLGQTECIIIMWNNSDPETFDHIPNLVDSIEEALNGSKIPIILIQNKMDLELNDSKASKTEEEFNQDIEKVKKSHPNVIHKKISLLNKNDYYGLILDIDRNLNNQDIQYNREIFHLVKYKYPFQVYQNQNLNDFKRSIMNIVLLGDTNTGKTSFIHYLEEKPIDNVVSTVAIGDYYLFGDVCDEKIRIRIVDTAGQERFKSISNDSIKKAHGFLLFFDVSNKETFNSIEDFLNQIQLNNDSNKILLIGNKIDEKQRKIEKELATKFADEKGIKYYECSTKYGINVFEILNEITFISFNRYKETYKYDTKTIKTNTEHQNFCPC